MELGGIVSRNSIRNRTVEFTSVDEGLVSFEVETFLPRMLLMKNPTSLTWKQETDMPIILSKICMMRDYLTFGGIFYDETKSVAMGNPLSPYVSYLLIISIHNNWHSKALLDKIGSMYVDDIFTIFH